MQQATLLAELDRRLAAARKQGEAEAQERLRRHIAQVRSRDAMRAAPLAEPPPADTAAAPGAPPHLHCLSSHCFTLRHTACVCVAFGPFELPPDAEPIRGRGGGVHVAPMPHLPPCPSHTSPLP